LARGGTCVAWVDNPAGPAMPPADFALLAAEEGPVRMPSTEVILHG